LFNATNQGSDKVTAVTILYMHTTEGKCYLQVTIIRCL